MSSSWPLPILIVPFFWLLISTLLSFLSGWFTLMKRFPDRPEASLLSLRGQSGSMSGVQFNGLLGLDVCPSGLRVRMSRVFGPFSRPFFVSWEEISAQAESDWLSHLVRLQFGYPVGQGALKIYSDVAARVAAMAPESWPGKELVKPVPERVVAKGIFRNWILMTSIAAAFFIIIPMIAIHRGARPPIAIAILFPAVVYGLWALLEYRRRTKG